MKLLLVDDEVYAVEALQNSVPWDDMGVDEVFACYNIQKAQEIIEAGRIDIIICDIEMPGGSGLELMKWIMEKDPRMIKILLTCHPDFSYAAKAIESGVFSYLLKPFTVEVLSDTLKKAAAELKKRDGAQSVRKAGSREATREQFWYELVTGVYQNSDLDYIKWQASIKEAAFSPERLLTPVMFLISSLKKDSPDFGVISYSIKNAFGEVLLKEAKDPAPVAVSVNKYVILQSGEKEEESEKEFETLREFFEQHYEIRMDWLLGKPSSYDQIAPQVRLLSDQAEAIFAALPSGKSESIVKQVINSIRQDPSSSREELAQKVFLSPDHLAKIFKKETGQTITDYATAIKIEEAKHLLAHTSQSISVIASNLSYSNFSYFSRLFKKETGMTPGQYRNKYKK